MKSYIVVIALIIQVHLTASAENPVLLVKDDLLGVSELMYQDLVTMGFFPDTLRSEDILFNTLEPYHLVIVCSGSNPNACFASFMRSALINRADANGKILIEGGETGYRALVSPSYLGFATKVLHSTIWLSDTDTSFHLNPVFENSNLAAYPNPLSANFIVHRTSNLNIDIVNVDIYSDKFFVSSNNNNSIGINVFPNVNEARIIYFSFDYSKITDRIKAYQYLENSVVNLMEDYIGIENESNLIAKQIELTAYPNPFNAALNITFKVPKLFRNAELYMSDIHGKNVINIFSGKNIYAGSYEYNINMNNIASGIYFLIFKANELVKANKIVMIK